MLGVGYFLKKKVVKYHWYLKEETRIISRFRVWKSIKWRFTFQKAKPILEGTSTLKVDMEGILVLLRSW